MLGDNLSVVAKNTCAPITFYVIFCACYVRFCAGAHNAKIPLRLFNRFIAKLCKVRNAISPCAKAEGLTADLINGLNLIFLCKLASGFVALHDRMRKVNEDLECNQIRFPKGTDVVPVRRVARQTTLF